MREAFEHRSREVIESFLNRSISYEECIAALDSAFTAIVTKVTGKELLAATALAMRNNETVTKEMVRREG
jgi:hypothetical protein